MPPDTTAVKKPAPIDYTPYVGKKFASKVTSGLNHGAEFKIVEVDAKFDFGTSGGIKPAFKVIRLHPSGKHWHACADFLKTHDEVTEEAPAAAQ